LPVFIGDKCDACGLCIAACPGQAIFRVDATYSDTQATVSFPYEYLPLPQKGDVVSGVNRSGKVVCQAQVLRVQKPKGFDRTAVITIIVPKELVMVVRSIQRLSEKP
jgi:Fe-S-cluster-containing hydrogenase component 2